MPAKIIERRTSTKISPLVSPIVSPLKFLFDNDKKPAKITTLPPALMKTPRKSKEKSISPKADIEDQYQPEQQTTPKPPVDNIQPKENPESTQAQLKAMLLNALGEMKNECKNIDFT